ncbi:hypothetical protein SELMODRAFT_67492, partial [Selaginella moellendorffii]
LSCWNSVLAAYARSGDPAAAESLFQSIPERNSISWTAAIAAYANAGLPAASFHRAREMELEGGAIADDLTFTAILGACIHHGSLREARFFFQSMISDHQIAATIEHYNCVIAALGKAGHTDRALELMGAMPFVPDSTTAKTLLAACGIHGELQLGSRAA